MLLYGMNEDAIYLFHQGTNYQVYQLLGCHFIEWEGEEGFRFAVWAPHAKRVAIAADFNEWKGQTHELTRLNDEGIWVGFFSDIPPNTAYKYHITTADNEMILKADPYAGQAEIRPRTASLTPSLEVYEWKDTAWQKEMRTYNPYTSPISIYEVHLGSWKLKENGDHLTYTELAETLIPYVLNLGFTHIELLPLAEHPFDLSWGYQITGYYAVTSRYGTPEEFKAFVDTCHRAGIGVIMDWVPGHFCKDDFGLRQFDGEALYEYRDLKKAEKHNWGTLAFDFGRPEVQSFLVSNAIYWLEEFHIDGIRVDAVASMLYLNFDRSEHEGKIFNSYGGEENLEATAFLRKLNKTVFQYRPNALMMAEDSTDYPLITAPTYLGGLGFNFKWNMGWMNDMLEYMEMDPIYRKWHHNLVTFSFMYTFTENFLFPLSHDEVVHGKKSLLSKMPGDQWQQFAGLRLLIGYMFSHPGKKLLFMGAELALYSEWKDKEELDWHLLDYPLHKGMFDYIKAIHCLFKGEPALYELDHEPEGFAWIDPHQIDQSVIAFRRRAKCKKEELVIVCNFTPNVHYDYKIGVPEPGVYEEIFNSDAEIFGGSGQYNDEHFSFPKKWHGLEQHIKIKVAPLAVMIFKRRDEEDAN